MTSASQVKRVHDPRARFPCERPRLPRERPMIDLRAAHVVDLMMQLLRTLLKMKVALRAAAGTATSASQNMLM